MPTPPDAAYKKRQHKPHYVRIINYGSLPGKLKRQGGRFLHFSTPRKPGQVYVLDTETGTQMRYETWAARWGDKSSAPVW